jgi:hypothetical protein
MEPYHSTTLTAVASRIVSRVRTRRVITRTRRCINEGNGQNQAQNTDDEVTKRVHGKSPFKGTKLDIGNKRKADVSNKYLEL